MEYAIVSLTMSLILLAFVPAVIAAYKGHRFSVWYIYGAVLFPAALVHAILLKKPIHCVNVYMQEQKKRKTYKALPLEKKKKQFSVRYVLLVFVSKLLFGAFCASALYTIFRIFIYDTLTLRVIFIAFAFIFSAVLSAIELLSISRVTMLADEITKRAIFIIFFSAISSVPMFIIKTLLCKTWHQYADFCTFLCSIVSFSIFIMLIIRMQQHYYSVFNRFRDYTVLSVLSYGMFAAVMLICVSFPKTREATNALCMPMKLFNTGYLSGVDKLIDVSYIYVSGISHLLSEIIILLSGVLCFNYKKKELQYRIEYRSKAFRMSRKRILRRHISSGFDRISPLK